MPRALRYGLLFAVSLSGVLLFLLASASGNTAFFERNYPVLLAVNGVIATFEPASEQDTCAEGRLKPAEANLRRLGGRRQADRRVRVTQLAANAEVRAKYLEV